MADLLDIRNEVSQCLSRVHILYLAGEAILKEDRETGNALCFALQDLREQLEGVKDGLAEISEAKS